MDKPLEGYNLPSRNHEETGNPNRPTTIKGTESVKTSIQAKPHQTEAQGDGFTAGFHQTPEEELTPTL